MSAPGTWLRRWAARWLPAETMARVVDPAVADLQLEVREARAADRPAQAVWLHAAGTLAVLRTVLLVGAQWVMAIPRQLRDDERRSLAHAGGGAIAAGVVALVLLAAWPYWVIGQWSDAGGPRLFLLLIPTAVPVAGAAALIAAALAAWRQVRAPRVLAGLALLALLVTLVSVFVSGWVLPVTNQSARVLVFGREVGRGLNELRLHELYALAAHGAQPADLLAHAAGEASRALHGRLAFALCPALFAVLALRLVRRAARPSGPAAALVPALLAYVGLMNLLTVPDVTPMSSRLQIWLPNLALMVAAHLARDRRHDVSEPGAGVP